MMEDHFRMNQHIKNRNREALEDLIKNVHWNFDRNLPYLCSYYEINNTKDSS